MHNKHDLFLVSLRLTKNIIVFTREPCAEGSVLATSLLQIWLRFTVNKFHLFSCQHILNPCAQARLLHVLLVIKQKPYWHQHHLYQSCRYYRTSTRWVVHSYEVFITTGVQFHLADSAMMQKTQKQKKVLLRCSIAQSHGNEPKLEGFVEAQILIITQAECGGFHIMWDKNKKPVSGQWASWWAGFLQTHRHN